MDVPRSRGRERTGQEFGASGRAVTTAAGDAAIADYDGFDFRALWKGREKVTAVEEAFLAEAFDHGDRRRLLEIGSGFGRLLGTLERIGDEVVASDFDWESLRRLRSAGIVRGRTRTVAVNLYHLPFAAGSFSGATMIRVHHHLHDPVAAFRELRRVLRPGARAVVSYNPRPTVGTLVNDLQRALHRSPEIPFRPITFSRSPRVELPPDPFPVYVAPRNDFDRAVRGGGFEPRWEMVSGLEEYYLMRHVPTSWFVRIGTTFGRAPGFPMRFAVLEVPRGPAPAWPPSEEILVCPRCAGELDRGTEPDRPTCRSCGFFGRREGAAIDLRYLPEGTHRWRKRPDAP